MLGPHPALGGSAGRDMAKPLRVLFASPEVAPLAKTGGLADVAGALPKALAGLGHDVRIIMPYFRQADDSGLEIIKTNQQVTVPIGDRAVSAGICVSHLGDVPVYLIDKPEYYDREYLYGTPEGDYPDNAERFMFFSKAVLAACKALDFQPDVVHCNDWQTGLVPALLRVVHRDDPFWSSVATVFTIHNLAYQGKFWYFDMPMTGLPDEVFTPEGIEFYGQINLMKAGIVYSDVINTVSKRYSEEIRDPEFGCGLEGILTARKDDLYGILNGVDYEVWSPETDPHIPANYSAAKLGGKRKCKRALLDEYGIAGRSNAPLIGMISRLAAQKGFDILYEAFDGMMKLGVSFVLLGTGDQKYHELFAALAEKYPKQVGVKLAFDNALAHRIEAGADMFLMPSRYEPCGLNQIYSLRYGTVPVVRATGGLDDTIVNFSPSRGTGTGFKFRDYKASALLSCVRRAVQTYADRESWKQLMRNAMQADFSWERSAKEYAKLYQKALLRHEQGPSRYMPGVPEMSAAA